MRIKNSYTGEITNDHVGSKAELKYYRVIDVSKRVDNPAKKFYTNKTEYFLHVLAERFEASILDNYTSSLRLNIASIEESWSYIKTLSDKRALEFILNIISTEPIVSFSTIDDDVITFSTPEHKSQDSFTVVKPRKRSQ